MAIDAHRTSKPDPLHCTRKAVSGTPVRYASTDFVVDEQQTRAICPAGKTLYCNGRGCTICNYYAIKFRGAQRTKW